MTDWNPEQHRRFAAERAQAFHDLLALIEPRSGEPSILVVGPGELTALAAGKLDVSEMIGIDNSRAMLDETVEHRSASVRFEYGDIGQWTSSADVDLVVAAASLQWLPNHIDVIERWRAALRPGGQIAIQVPANADMPSHAVARRVAEREPYLSLFGTDGPPIDPVQAYVLQPEEYAQILFDLGFERQHVRLQVHPPVLPSSRLVAEWVRATMLSRFENRLDSDTFAAFVAEYDCRGAGAHEAAAIGERDQQCLMARRVAWRRDQSQAGMRSNESS